MFCIMVDSMMKPAATQQDRAIALLESRGLVRLSEFVAEGITAATISRMEKKGAVMQLGRGLYQLSGICEEPNPLAFAAKLVPNGIICHASALAFHGLAEARPITWIGIGPREWRPRLTQRTIQVARYSPKAFDLGWKTHQIGSVPVKIYEPAKTIADLFQSARHQQIFYETKTGITEAMKHAKEAMRQRKATKATITRYADQIGILKFMEPYLEAVTVDA
jgi:predicted transcriptional regulator of viral defense system